MKKFARTVRGLVHGLDASKCSKSAVINSSYSVNKHMVSLESSIGTRVQILDELVNYWGSRFFEVQTDTNKRYYIHESFLEVEPEPKKYAYTVPGARIQCIDASKCSKLQLRDGSMPLSETLTWLAGDMRVEVLDKFTSKLGTNGLYFEIKTDDDRRCYVHDSLIALVRGDWSYFKGVKGAGWGWACKCPGPIIRMDGCLRCERCNVERPLGSPPCSQPTEPTEQDITWFACRPVTPSEETAALPPLHAADIELLRRVEKALDGSSHRALLFDVRWRLSRASGVKG